MQIEHASRQCASQWLGMRRQLWPDAPLEEHEREVGGYFGQDNRQAIALIAVCDNRPVGFAEASIRHEQVNGSDTSPVGFLEGLFVEPEYRRKGIASALSDAVASWVRGKGYTELASDTDWENPEGIAWHRSQGFEETERVIFYRKRLTTI